MIELKELDLHPRIIEVFESQGIHTLYPPQSDALRHALKGENVVLAVPTAGGKSLVAYLTILKSVIAGGKAIYIVPLRALAAEKYSDLKQFEKLGIRVGISIGDFDTPDLALEKYDIIVATSEKTDSLLRHKSQWLKKLSVVVADEIHLINDFDRGPTLEVTLAKFRQFNPNAQIVALSATIRNSDALAEWLNARHVKSDWRPVVLKEGVYLENEIYFVDGAKKRIMARTEDSAIDLAIDTVVTGGQALIFANNRKSAETLARHCSMELRTVLTDKELKNLSRLASKILDGAEEPTTLGEKLATCVRYGAAFHHAGLTNEHRMLIEHAYRDRLLKCISATPTLAAGINMPARRVIIHDIMRYDNKRMRPIPVLEIKQMMGRAGRPKYDREGEAVLIAKNEYERTRLLTDYILSTPEDIESKLATEPALRTHLLAAIATGTVSNREELLSFIGGTFFAHQSDVWKIESIIDQVLEFLEKKEMVSVVGEELQPTLLGKRVSDLYIDPLSAVKLVAALNAIKGQPPEFGVLHAICSTPDIDRLYFHAWEHNRLQMLIAEHEHEFLCEIPSNEHDYAFFLEEVKTASLLHDWIDEMPEKVIEQRYNIGPGDIRTKIETAVWLLHSMGELARVLRLQHLRYFNELTLRTQYGIKAELLDLVQLEGVGRARARTLYQLGYKTREELKRAKVEELSKTRGIGKKLATAIVAQLRPKTRKKEPEKQIQARIEMFG